MSRIILEGIEVYSFHGHLREERKIGGKYRVDIAVELDTEKAEESDKLKDTVNYERIFQIVQSQMSEPSKLLEHIGRKVIIALKSEFPNLDSIDLTIAKLHPPIPGIMKSVAVQLNYKK